MKKGFTLAEALLTMVIIGFLSMILIPTLNTGTRDKALYTQAKKAVSTLQDAITLKLTLDGNPADNRNLFEWLTDDTNGEHKVIELEQLEKNINSYATINGFIYRHIGSNTPTAKKCTQPGTCIILIDINGSKGPTNFYNKQITQEEAMNGKDTICLFINKGIVVINDIGNTDNPCGSITNECTRRACRYLNDIYD